MSHKLTIRFLDKLNAQLHMTDEEYKSVCYYLEVFSIDFLKALQIFVLAYLSGVLKESLIMIFSYRFLRKYAGGWHALSSSNCSLISFFCFVGLPLVIKQNTLYSYDYLLAIFSSITVLCVYLYAPADTEKNPLVSLSERKIRRKKAICFVLVTICIAFIQSNLELRMLLVTGLFIESMVITPFTYKLTKRSYKNYENYEKER